MLIHHTGAQRQNCEAIHRSLTNHSRLHCLARSEHLQQQGAQNVNYSSVGRGEHRSLNTDFIPLSVIRARVRKSFNGEVRKWLCILASGAESDTDGIFGVRFHQAHLLHLLEAVIGEVRHVRKPCRRLPLANATWQLQQYAKARLNASHTGVHEHCSHCGG